MRRRTIAAVLGALVATLAVLAGVRLYPSSNPDIGFASPGGDLACSVKASCDVGEVAVFRMSAQANAHAQTADSHAVTYPQTVCCSGPPGLSTACSWSYDTVLTLSAANNAHAASDGSYGTEVCLSAPNTVMRCYYEDGVSCEAGYACLATISGTTNAHVADCDGSLDDYDTKVCCAAHPCLFSSDADCDACYDISEPGLPPPADSTDRWDWYDVPVPTLFSGGHISGDPSGQDSRDHAVSIINDVLAVLEYSGTSDGGPPNAAGRQYNQDVNTDGVDDGIAYDRSVGATRSGGADGAVTIIVDVLLVLAQSGQMCSPP